MHSGEQYLRQMGLRFNRCLINLPSTNGPGAWWSVPLLITVKGFGAAVRHEYTFQTTDFGLEFNAIFP